MGWIVATFLVPVFPGSISRLLTHTDAFELDSDLSRGRSLQCQRSGVKCLVISSRPAKPGLPLVPAPARCHSSQAPRWQRVEHNCSALATNVSTRGVSRLSTTGDNVGRRRPVSGGNEARPSRTLARMGAALLRDECLNVNEFWSQDHARVVTTDWKTEYNQIRRHSSPGYLPPAVSAATCTHRN